MTQTAQTEIRRDPAGSFVKVVRPGTINGGRSRFSVFCSIEFDGKRLSITGVEGPLASGNARGGCGQIEMHYMHRNPGDDSPYERDGKVVWPDRDTLTGPQDFVWAEGWDADLWLDFLYVWKHYHCNDLQAACEHQRTLGWTYQTHRDRACPECGYKIGSGWFTVEVPPVVLKFLRSLPDTDKDPAWV